MSRTRAKRIAVIALVGVVTFVTLSVMGSVVAEAAAPGDTGADVTAIQQDLRALGYVSVAADGVYGPRTERAVRHFQRANGLLVDGEAGPVTSSRLDRAAGGRATPQAAAPAAAPRPASTATGNCAEWADEMAYFGLPDSMRSIMYRESRCRTDVTSRTGCCHGLFQIHRMHVPSLDACDIDSTDDLFDGVKNVCAASVLYKRSGTSPWRL